MSFIELFEDVNAEIFNVLLYMYYENVLTYSQLILRRLSSYSCKRRGCDLENRKNLPLEYFGKHNIDT